MNIYELQATLTLDTSGFRQSVEEAGAVFRSLGDSLGGSAEGFSERASAVSGMFASLVSALGGEGSGILSEAAESTALLFSPFVEGVGERIGEAAGAFAGFGAVMAQILGPTAEEAAAQNEVNAVLSAGGEAVAETAAAVGMLPEALAPAADALRNWAEEAGAGWSSAADAASSAGSLIAGVFAGQIPQSALSAVEAVSALPGAFSAVGQAMASGLGSGFSSLWDSVVSAIRQKVSGLVSGVKGLLGIQSPSKVFADIGGNMARGLAAGWRSEFSAAESAVLGSDGLGSVERLARRGILSDRLGFEESAIGRSSAAAVTSAASDSFGMSARTSPVEIRLLLDSEVAAEALYDPLRQVALRKGVGERR